MVNAGRVLIIPQGEWTNLRPYVMLDLVSEGDKAYLARQASVGVRPSEDISMTYWQPFGSSASIATTDTPGLVMPDGVTITVDETGLIVANLNVADLKDIKLTNLANGDFLKYDGTQNKWVNVALGTAATRNATSSIASGSTALIESGAVDSLKQTLETAISDEATARANADAQKANKSDLASISVTGTTNNTGSTITKGTYFYKSGTLVQAIADIANGANLTKNTNYKEITAGGLNELKTNFDNYIVVEARNVSISANSGAYTVVVSFTAKTGYTAVGLAGYTTNNRNGNYNITGVFLSDTNKVTVQGVNGSSSALSSTWTFHVIFRKNIT